MSDTTQAWGPPAPGWQAGGPPPTLEYDAFLSYTHRDRPVASGIQKGLHQIGRRLGQLRALRVFRDDTDLTVRPDLWAASPARWTAPASWWSCYRPRPPPRTGSTRKSATG
ncbi:hypothetical protein [Mycobacterium parmense]|uniref:TIR domain-containing protein n=1 Tax=Mycobacterium parmense TaxID=185642 RepID=A0A7I7YWI5_9MYCO|nr:hypothetical protein [Mycobacterium parmense]BBZ45647.1 hypothetical protein MPRM_29280 [Mycobacterium parmense]